MRVIIKENEACKWAYSTISSKQNPIKQEKKLRCYLDVNILNV